jgi:hypothetical protein
MDVELSEDEQRLRLDGLNQCRRRDDSRPAAIAAEARPPLRVALLDP